MSELVLVEADGVRFYVQAEEVGGVGTVGLDDVMSFQGVSDTVKAIGQSLVGVWQDVKPDEAVVEFGLQVTAKSGKLTGLLVEGGGEASLKVTMTWKSQNPGG